jgi:threonine synthase
MTNYLTGFKCINCLKVFPEDYEGYICDKCHNNLDAVYDYKSMADEFSINKLKEYIYNDVWRYKPLFPFFDIHSVVQLSLPVTPLYRFNMPETDIEVFLKDDTRQPSASFKDRASAVIAAVASEKSKTIIACASTGNAGASMACIAAASGLKAIVYVPKRAPEAKIAQMKVYGADVCLVDGKYDDAYDLCVEDSIKNNYFNRCTGYNPYTREGKKSVSFEIWEQLGYKAPGTVIVPVGDGNIISGVYKGFKDLKELGLIGEIPQLIGVQSEKSSAIVKTLEKLNGLDNIPETIKIETVQASTVADSISVDRPRDGLAAVKAIFESSGFAIQVSDDEIIESIYAISAATGVFPEPAGAASIAGLKKMISTGSIENIRRPVVCLVTGSGLKDVGAVL